MPKALILRTCDKDMKSHGGFQWPESGWAEAPDWQPTKECGNGLHGLLWGEGDASLLAHGDPTSKWMVAEIDTEEMIDLEEKVKVRRANVVHVGTKVSAITYICANGGQGRAVAFGTATAGDSGTATAGYRGTATAGDRGTATAGDSGTATAGEDGVISVLWWDSSAQKYRRAVGVIGEGDLKPGVPYRLDSKGQWLEANKTD